MLTIIHGEDLAKSRNYYISEREKYPDKVILDGASLTLTDFLQATSGSGLFGDQQAIFIEDLLSKRKPSKELDSIIQELLTTNDLRPMTIYLWESKDLTAKQLSPYKGATIKQFKIPPVVFSFLDSLLPKNGKKSISLFHNLLNDEDPNFALFMLQRQVRILLALRSWTSQDDKVISEVSRLAPWQKGKLEKQAKAFSVSQLLSLHSDLYTLEYGQKTGQLSQPLDQAIDFFLLAM